ncbi:MAG: hypothetical protein OXK82_00055, partial [Deltaproteobacteria bacterium]|nr:hypothetical protein [Deltaproteobacteria bacterium]
PSRLAGRAARGGGGWGRARPPPPGGRVGVLPGSFNPPTVAHLELARAARRRFGLDTVAFSLSSVIVDKERVEGLCREDRLLLVSLLTADDPWAAAVVVNRGLYSEQAPAFRTCFGGDADLRFIVGMDKVLQIFDPRYYEDRDAALDTLFAHVRLIAANREDWGDEALRGLLDRSENAPYRDRVQSLTLPPHLRNQSSSAVRRGVEGGEPAGDAAAPAVREFIEATGAYRERYELRLAALDRLYTVREWAKEQVALDTLLARAEEPGKAGADVREILHSPMPPEDLKTRLRNLGLTRTPLRSAPPE